MDVRKKIFLDLFAAPSTLLPVVGGLSLVVLGWALDLGSAVEFVGVLGVLGGLGLAATRLIFGIEQITNRAYQYVQEQEKKKREKELDGLDRLLVRDGEPRTQSALREARLHYRSLAEDVEAGRVAGNAQEVLDKVESMFQACTGQLRRSYELWSAARTMSGAARQRVLKQREALVQEVVGSVEHLGRMIEQLRAASAGAGERDLGHLRQELDEAIEVARRTEQRLAGWEKKPYSEKEFEGKGD